MLWRPAPASAQSAASPEPAEDNADSPPWRLPEPDPLAWVHLQGPRGLVLERDLDSVHHKDFSPMCTAPCDKQVPTTLYFRVSGGGLFSSKDFELNPDDRGRATVRVSGGSIPVYILGVIGLSGGIGAAGTGVAFELGAFGGMGDSGSVRNGLYLMAFGAPVAILGAVMMAKSSWPEVEGDVLPAVFADPHRPRRRRRSSFSVTPFEWPREAAAALLPHVWTVPILGGMF
jgi:hypothetical protein